MGNILYEYVFTVIVNGTEEYITYQAYSKEQASYLLSLDGYDIHNIVDVNYYQLGRC